MPYIVTVCRSCDRMTSDPEHGPEDETCYAKDRFGGEKGEGDD